MNQIADSLVTGTNQAPSCIRRNEGAQGARTRRSRAANFRPTSSEIGEDETMGGKVASVYGPYPNGDKWRLVVLTSDGRRKSKVVDTYEQAQGIKQTLAASLSDDATMPIATAIGEFLAHKRKQD